jgi:hypothetical protein
MSRHATSVAALCFTPQSVVRRYRRMINDNVVRRAAPNHENVASQLMRWKITVFVIQNQANHFASNFTDERTALESAYAPNLADTSPDRASPTSGGAMLYRMLLPWEKISILMSCYNCYGI